MHKTLLALSILNLRNPDILSRHAPGRRFVTLVFHTELITVCSPIQAELDAAKQGFPGVHTYTDYEQILL